MKLRHLAILDSVRCFTAWTSTLPHVQSKLLTDRACLSASYVLIVQAIR